MIWVAVVVVGVVLALAVVVVVAIVVVTSFVTHALWSKKEKNTDKIAI